MVVVVVVVVVRWCYALVQSRVSVTFRVRRVCLFWCCGVRCVRWSVRGSVVQCALLKRFAQRVLDECMLCVYVVLQSDRYIFNTSEYKGIWNMHYAQ